MKDVSRRTFLETGAATLVSAALSQAGKGVETPQPPEAPEPLTVPPAPGRKLGIAVVGLGKLAVEEILPAFAKSEHCRVTGLVSGHPEKAKVLAERYGVKAEAIYSYDTYERMRENPEIEAVYLVLPNSLHAEFTIRAAKMGKHVLCEKPMCVSVEEGERMIAACAEAKRTLMIAYRIQYEPHNVKVRELVQKKAFGAARIIMAENTQQAVPGTWRLMKALSGGGSLPDIGLYCLNTTRFLLGEEPVEVSAMTYSTPGDERFKEVEEVMQFTLRFGSGAILNAICSYGAADVKAYRVIAEKGQIKADPAFEYKGLRLYTEPAAEEGEPRMLTEVVMPEGDQFATEMDHFAVSIFGGKAVKTPGEEGLRDMKLMAALYQSAAEGRAIGVGRGD